MDEMICEHKGMFGVICSDDANMVADPVDLELHGDEFLVFLCSAHVAERLRDI
jgi:hypothetical protein